MTMYGVMDQTNASQITRNAALYLISPALTLLLTFNIVLRNAVTSIVHSLMVASQPMLAVLLILKITTFAWVHKSTRPLTVYLYPLLLITRSQLAAILRMITSIAQLDQMLILATMFKIAAQMAMDGAQSQSNVLKKVKTFVYALVTSGVMKSVLLKEAIAVLILILTTIQQISTISALAIHHFKAALKEDVLFAV